MAGNRAVPRHLYRCRFRSEPAKLCSVITDVVVHIVGEMPIKCDLVVMPAGGDRSIRCTNVRTIDGKRPAFVHDPQATFILPLSTIRVIEMPAPADAAAAGSETGPEAEPGQLPAGPAVPVDDEEPDEDLLARIRSL